MECDIDVQNISSNRWYNSNDEHLRFTYLFCMIINPKGQQQCYEVENGKHVLCETNVDSMICDVIQHHEDINKPCGIAVQRRNAVLY